MIFRRLVFVGYFTLAGFATLPTLVIWGDDGLDALADRLNIVADWAGL